VNSATWGFVGVVVGGGMSVGAEWLRLKSGAQISKEQKKHEIRVGRDTFQKDNLLNLQGDLARWIKAANSAFVLEIGWIRRSQAFSPLPPEVTLDIFETTQLGGEDHRRQTSVSAI
jgi:Na+/glutamate symporter